MPTSSALLLAESASLRSGPALDDNRPAQAPRSLNGLQRLLEPGVQLLDRMPMAWKLGLITISLLVPLVIFMWVSLQQQWETYQYGQAELQGLHLVELSLPVALTVERIQDLQLRGHAGDGSATAALRDAQTQLGTELAQLAQAVAGTQAFTLADVWADLYPHLNGLTQHADEGSLLPMAPLRVRLQQFTQLIGERSGLVLDPEARSYFLMDALINTGFPLIDAASVLRGEGSALLQGADINAMQRQAQVSRVAELRQQLGDTRLKLAAYARAGGPELPNWTNAQDSLRRLADQTETLFAADAPAAPASRYFELGTQALQATENFERQVAFQLREEVVTRQHGTLRTGLGLALAFGGGLLAMAYLLGAFYGGFSRSLRLLKQSVASVASGDLSGRIQLTTKDEFRDIADLLDQMTEHLSGLVSEIRSTSSRVDMAGLQVADGSRRLSERTEQQSDSLRSSVANIEQLSTAVASNAEAACQLDELARALRTEAEAGHSSMAEAVAAMSRMKDASARVSETLAVIDDVAFQTGMLSLNATVEAARAGEAGKGFGVVASEVRQLAKRSADSAEEIRRQISESDEQVRQGSEWIRIVSRALDTIVQGVQDVSDQLRGISTASTQQSTGLEEVTRSVGDLDAITQENAAMVEQSHSAAQTLMERAEALRTAVSSMRLRHGSADEALGMVEKAVAHLQVVGRAQALQDFHRAETGFIDRDLYLFAFDRHFLFSVNGSDPGLVGKHVDSVPGLAHTRFAEDAWAMAQNGGGWVRYEVISPLSGQIMPKESYVLALSADELIGCGCYQGHSGR